VTLERLGNVIVTSVSYRDASLADASLNTPENGGERMIRPRCS
jgi:hypothetical protein